METQQIEQDGAALVVGANDIAVVDAESYTAAGESLKDVKEYQARVKDVMDPICDAAHKAHKVATAKRSELLAPAKEAERIVKAAMLAWSQAEEKRAREEQAAAEAAARKEAEEAQLALAAEVEAGGDHEGADAILDAPTYTPPVVARKAAPKVAGISVRTTWSAEVTDLGALVRAIAKGSAPLNAIVPNMTALNGMARAMKGQLRVAGVRVIESAGMAAGKR